MMASATANRHLIYECIAVRSADTPMKFRFLGDIIVLKQSTALAYLDRQSIHIMAWALGNLSNPDPMEDLRMAPLRICNIIFVEVIFLLLTLAGLAALTVDLSPKHSFLATYYIAYCVWLNNNVHCYTQ